MASLTYMGCERLLHQGPHRNAFPTAFTLLWPLIVFGLVLSHWFGQLKNMWRYELRHNTYYAQNTLTLLNLRGEGWLWNWETITFPSDSVADVRRVQWNSLPALRVTLNKTGRRASAVPLFLIYAEQDAPTVEGRFLPLMEQYRVP